MPANSRWDLIRRLRVNPVGIFYSVGSIAKLPNIKLVQEQEKNNKTRGQTELNKRKKKQT